MAIADLLWACPSCGEDRGIARAKKATCRRCGTRYDRVDGAHIRARSGGEEVTRSAAEWIRRLPAPASLLDVEPGEPVRRARVRARSVVGEEVVRDQGEYLNRIEVYGDEAPGTLELTSGGATYTPDDGPEASWPFSELAAVQASSRALQLKGRGRPLVSFGFEDDSSFLWERLLEAAVKRHYRVEGLGEVVELQPRICVR